MSEKQVRGILGNPTRVAFGTRVKARQLIYSYSTPLDEKGEGKNYSNYYAFKGGKLSYLELARSALGGA